MNKLIIFLVALIILAGAIFWAFQAGFLKPQAVPEGIILFYGDGCSHCKNVDDYIKQNNIEEKVKFIKLEVWYDKANSEILKRVVQKCNITSSEIGVPFLYDGVKCYEGEVEAINFFKNAANIQ